MLTELPYAYGKPSSSGQIKNSPADFSVDERLSFALTGEGEHLFLFIEKNMLNTEEMTKIIARTLNVHPKLVSYAGLKDKFAKTRQWFGVHLPGVKDVDLQGLHSEQYQVLEAVRHNKKLKIGALKENHFTIRVHNLIADEPELNSRVEQIKAHGIPNYFGPQRFGHQGNNLTRAKELLLEGKKFKDRHLRGIYYSAARSFLFNEILKQRVNANCWNSPVAGDLMMLAGTHSCFQLQEMDAEIQRRIAEHDISPAGVLWGKGNEMLREQALLFQDQALSPWLEWCNALEVHGLLKQYRSLVLMPENLQFKEDTFSFTLPPGAFATTLLRELFSNEVTL